MECNCRYFNFVNGVLICSQCGKPLKPGQNPIEDKMLAPPANKVLKKIKR